jgi:hypothetical protein
MKETFIHIVDLTSSLELIHTTSKGISIEDTKAIVEWLKQNPGPYYNIEVNNSPLPI